MNRLWVAAAVVAANAAVAVVVALGLMFYALVAVIAVLVAIVVFQRPQRGLLLLAAGLPFDGLRIPLGVPDVDLELGRGDGRASPLVAALVARPGLARPEPGRAWPGWVPGLIGLALLGVASLRMVDAFQVVVGMKVTFQAVTMAYVAWRCPLEQEGARPAGHDPHGRRSDLRRLGHRPAGPRTGRPARLGLSVQLDHPLQRRASCGRSRPSSSRSRSPSS